MRRVVVTGLGVVSPLGIGIEEHWAALISPRSAITRSKRLADQGFPVDVAAEITEESLRQHLNRLPRKQLKLYSRVTLFGMIASSLAAEDAGLASAQVDPTRIGVFFGTFFTVLDFSAFLKWMAATESKEVPQALDLPRANEYCITSIDRKSTRLNSSHIQKSRMPSSA